jgi:pSer/pThr/pTyr-binding forkhead associated (FHA) protein
VFSIAASALYTTLGKRGTIRQFIGVIVICAVSALFVFPVMIWYNSHFVAHQEIPSITDVTLVLVCIAFFGWLLPLGTTTTYCLFGRPRQRGSNSMAIGSTTLQQVPQVEQHHRPTSLLPPPQYQPGTVAPFAYDDEAPWGWLEYSSGNFQGQRLALKRIRATIGRDEACDIWLDDDMASRFHAELSWSQNQPYLTDCGSLNGILCNGQKVQGTIMLQDKDTISIGAHHFLFIRAEHKADPLADDDPLNRHTWRSTEDLLTASSKQEIIDLNNSFQQSSSLPSSAPQKSGALTFCDGVLAGRTVSIDRPILTIGSAPGCHIIVIDASIAPQHARLLNHEGNDYLQAISNQDDTFINNEVLRGSRLLQPGDIIGLGNLHLIYITIPPTISPTTSQPGIVTPQLSISHSSLRGGPLPLRLPSRQK